MMVSVKEGRGRVQRTRFRDPGVNRQVRLTKSGLRDLVEIVRKERKQRITFTDPMMPGMKAVVSITGSVTYYHQWTAAKGKRRYDKIIRSTVNGVDPAVIRDVVRARVEKIARGIDPSVPEETTAPVLSKFISENLGYLENKYANFATISSQLNCWILPYFSGDRDKPLDEYSKRDIIGFVELVAEKRSAITANRCLYTLSGIFKRAVDLEVIDRNPCQGVRKLQEGDSRDRDLTAEELSSVLKVLNRKAEEGDEIAELTLLGLSTGKRFGELIKLPWDQVHLADRYFKIPAPRAKNRKWDRVELNSVACEILTKMHAKRVPGEKWVFPSDRSESGHWENHRPRFKAILSEAEIEDFRFHDTRRVHASLLLNAGVPLEVVQKALNHDSIKSTQIYARLKRQTVADASEKAAQKLKDALDA